MGENQTETGDARVNALALLYQKNFSYTVSKVTHFVIEYRGLLVEVHDKVLHFTYRIPLILYL